jgi:hypothetical protein
MGGGHVQLRGSILATAVKDEHAQTWRAFVYSNDVEGEDLRYLGTHEMKIFEKEEAKINRLQQELSALHATEVKIDRLKKELDAQRHYYLDMGRPISYSNKHKN